MFGSIAPGRELSDTEREIRELESRWARAVIDGDRAFYESILADDFTHTSHAGAFKTRAQWLAESKSSDRSPAKTVYESYGVDDLAVRIYGDTAVATGRTTPKGKTASGKEMTGQYRFLRVWVRRNGQWKAVAFQGTRIAQP
jgi:ketosteroid isomerase-like protein